MEAPVLCNKSDEAEPLRTPMSNLTSEEPEISWPTVDSWPEGFRPSSYGKDPRRRRPGSFWSKYLAKRSEPWRPKCVNGELRLLRGISNQFNGCKAVGADPLLRVNRDVSYKITQLERCLFCNWQITCIYSFGIGSRNDIFFFIHASKTVTGRSGWNRDNWLNAIGLTNPLLLFHRQRRHWGDIQFWKNVASIKTFWTIAW